ncbi:MAG: 1,4-alpha-glucan branching protein GlgB [Mobilitalea sp.]
MRDAKREDFLLVDEMQRFNEGNHFTSYTFLGSKPVAGGYRFTVWAPNAKSVGLSGDFSDWKPLPMEPVFETGAWTLINSLAKQGDCYKYFIEDQDGNCHYKLDPYAFAFEMPPKDASLIYDFPKTQWKDGQWMRARKQKPVYQKPLNIYEVHPSSWKRHPDGRYYSFYDLVESLIPYVKEMGYTHIEFMPLMDYPLEASWGYQITGYYAVSARYGNCEGLSHFVNEAHQAGIGVIVDWVPGHFCRNDYALAYYDGTPTYEYNDVNRANNVRWGTLNFDLGKAQVHSFLISNAMYWLREFHLDGLRVDAVSNMLYLDYDDGPWTPNEDGSNHNRQGISFLQKLNTTVFHELPEVYMIAEESTAWENVTQPVEVNGLGFNFKWNMGWMNDTLRFFEMNPYQREQHFNLVTFIFVYLFHENFIMPLSHDEVVHGKRSLLGKVEGDRYNQFAQLRVLQGYMMGMPGKKLNFMGNELGQFLEWRFYQELEWKDLNYPYNREYQHYICSINYMYQEHKALYQRDHEEQGITVLEAEAPLLVFYRHGLAEKEVLIFIYNFAPREYQDHLIGMPYKGSYEVILNSESKEFGGSWEKPHSLLKTSEVAAHQRQHSIRLIIPAMSMVVIKPKRIYYP